MNLGTLIKSPEDLLDYDISFEEWLDDGDRLTGFEAKIENSSATVNRSDYTDNSVRLWIEGGNIGDTAHVDIIAETLLGRTKKTCFKLRIKECG